MPTQTDALHALDELVADFAEALSTAKVVGIIETRVPALLRARAIVLASASGPAGDLALQAASPTLPPEPVVRLLREEASPLRRAAAERAPVVLPAAKARETGLPAEADEAWAFLPLVIRRRVIGAVALALPKDHGHDFQAGLPALVLRQCALALDRAFLHESETQFKEELEAEGTRFRSLVQELDAVFWEADPDTFLFSFVSHRAAALFGYPLTRWYEPGFWASIIHPDDRTWAVDFCVQCTRDGEDHVFEYRIVDARGQSHWVRDVVYVLRDDQGKPRLLRGVMLDVTRDRVAASGAPLAKRLARRPAT